MGSEPIATPEYEIVKGILFLKPINVLVVDRFFDASRWFRVLYRRNGVTAEHRPNAHRFREYASSSLLALWQVVRPYPIACDQAIGSDFYQTRSYTTPLGLLKPVVHRLGRDRLLQLN